MAANPVQQQQQQNQSGNSQEQQVQEQIHRRIYNQHYAYVWQSFSSLDKGRIQDAVVCFFHVYT